MTRPTVLACGMGVNTIGLLAEYVRQGWPIDAILFGDTGGEHEWVYRYIPILSAWLVERGYPLITVLRHTREDGSIETLEEECLRTGRLPSLAYGSSRLCSGKYKMEPQDKWLNHWQPALDAWARKERVIKLIGYDADEQYRIDTADEWNDDRYLAMWREGATFIDIARHFAGPEPDEQSVYQQRCSSPASLDGDPPLDEAVATAVKLHQKLVRSLVRKVTATCKYEKQSHPMSNTRTSPLDLAARLLPFAKQLDAMVFVIVKPALQRLAAIDVLVRRLVHEDS